MPIPKRTLLGRSDGSIAHVGCTDSMGLDEDPAEDLGDVLAKGLADGPTLEEPNKNREQCNRPFPLDGLL